MWSVSPDAYETIYNNLLRRENLNTKYFDPQQEQLPSDPIQNNSCNQLISSANCRRGHYKSTTQLLMDDCDFELERQELERDLRNLRCGADWQKRELRRVYTGTSSDFLGPDMTITQLQTKVCIGDEVECYSRNGPTHLIGTVTQLNPLYIKPVGDSKEIRVNYDLDVRLVSKKWCCRRRKNHQSWCCVLKRKFRSL